jgi:hypothetical protein
MNTTPHCCPFPDCKHHLRPPAKFYWRKGSFHSKSRACDLVRYQCSACRRTFSNRTWADDVGQRRPDINRMLSRLMSAGVTLRDCAWILEVARKTVARRASWLAERARQAHAQALAQGSHQTGLILFDEMQSFEKSKACPLTIALAVRQKTGAILSAKVGRIPANGPLASLGASKYGWTVNEADAACSSALFEASQAAEPACSVACDGATPYPNLIWGAMPSASVKICPSGGVGGGFDVMFRLNHKRAKIRARVAVMARKTWATTKDRHKLQDKLDVYIAVENGYEFC